MDSATAFDLEERLSSRSEARDLRTAVIPTVRRDLRGRQNVTQWSEEKNIVLI